MKKLIYPLFIFISLFSFLSCNKETPEHKTEDSFKTNDGYFYETPLGSFKLSERTIFLTDQGDGGITITDNSTLTLDKKVFKEKPAAKIGDIILYTNTGDVPNGFLGQVEGIIDNGDELVFHTSTVELDNVFDEIHIAGNARFPKEVSDFLDENGEKLSCSIVDNSIWDTLDGYELFEKPDTSETKSSITTKSLDIESHVEQTFEFEIKAGEYASGKLYLGLGIYATANKDAGGKLECDFSILTKLGVKGELTLKDLEKKIPFLKVKQHLPMDVIVGPLILTPQLVLENGFKANAKVSLESDLSMELFSMVFKAGYYDNAPHFSFEPSASSDSYFKVISLEGSAGLSLYTNVAIEMATYGIRDILAVGVEGEDESQIALSADVSFASKDLLSLNPNLSIGKNRSVGSYIHSLAFKFMGAPDGKFSAKKTFEAKADIGLFPEHVNNVTSRVNSGIRASASGLKKGLTAVAEHGFALFKKDNVVEHRNILISETKSSNGDLCAEFELPDDDSDYSIKEYVKVMNSEGEYYFYKEIGICPDDNHIHAIDMGLSVKWSCCNLGSITPEINGDCFAWGTITPNVFSSGNNELNFDISGTQYDAAHTILGEGWRMPTKNEFEELLGNCSIELDTINDVQGFMLTSQITGNSIFFPEPSYSKLDNGGYWTSTPAPYFTEGSNMNDAYFLGFTTEKEGKYCWWDCYHRGLLNHIRPVCDN